MFARNCKQPIKENYLLSSKLEYTNEPYAIFKIAGIKNDESFNIQHKTNYKYRYHQILMVQMIITTKIHHIFFQPL